MKTHRHDAWHTTRAINADLAASVRQRAGPNILRRKDLISDSAWGYSLWDSPARERATSGFSPVRDMKTGDPENVHTLPSDSA